MTQLIGFFVSIFISAFSSAAAKPVTPDEAMEIQAPAAAPPRVLFTFDHERVGSFPAGLKAEVIGKGSGAKWLVKTDSTAPSTPNVLAQSGSVDSGPNFAAAFIDGSPIQDADVSVKFKAVSGDDTAQDAAIIYRYQNPQTYYVVIADSQNDMLMLLYPKKGKLKPIDQKQVIITANIWHTLRVIFVLNTYRAYMDGELIMAGKDKNILTAGRLALATSADAATYFDDVTLSEAKAISR